MVTVTLQQPSTETHALLDACDREGMVRILSEGRCYLLRAEAKHVEAGGRDPQVTAPDFQARLAKIFPQTLTVEQTAAVDRMIAGE